MFVTISPSSARGIITTPSSKSATHRALICASLSEGVSKIRSPLISDDTLATTRVLQQLGTEIKTHPGHYEVSGGHLEASKSNLFCEESGTTLRLVTPICGLVTGETILTGGPSLSKRPMAPLLSGLKQLGVKCLSSEGYPPIKVNGTGSILGGEAHIRGDISSQFISGLLLISPLTEVETTINLTTSLQSKPYVKMTLDALRAFNVEVSNNADMSYYEIKRQKYQSTDYQVEGDWSSAAFMIAAGAIAGDVTINNLSKQSHQADKAILKILEEMGADFNTYQNSVQVVKSQLSPLKYDLENSPDLFPIVTALCAYANGESKLTGLSRLKYKESDRLTAMIEGLKKMNIKLKLEENTLTIQGGTPQGARVDSYQDHRIAMAFAIIALNADGETLITDSECVSKSYPSFWKHLQDLGTSLRSDKNE